MRNYRRRKRNKNKQDGNRDLSERSVLIFRGMVRLLFQPSKFNISHGGSGQCHEGQGLNPQWRQPAAWGACGEATDSREYLREANL